MGRGGEGIHGAAAGGTAGPARFQALRHQGAAHGGEAHAVAVAFLAEGAQLREMAIFDRSWYGRVLVERVEKLTPKAQWSAAFQDIVDFERALAEDGYLIIKFFLHISKAEQKKRLKALEADPMTAWQVEPEDWVHHRKYNQYLAAIEDVLARTETEWAPWTIVEATQRRWARVKVFETLVGRLEAALTARGKPLPEPPEAPASVIAAAGRGEEEDEGRHEPAELKRGRGKRKGR